MYNDDGYKSFLHSVDVGCYSFIMIFSILFFLFFFWNTVDAVNKLFRRTREFVREGKKFKSGGHKNFEGESSKEKYYNERNEQNFGARVENEEDLKRDKVFNNITYITYPGNVSTDQIKSNLEKERDQRTCSWDINIGRDSGQYSSYTHSTDCKCPSGKHRAQNLYDSQRYSNKCDGHCRVDPEYFDRCVCEKHKDVSCWKSDCSNGRHYSSDGCKRFERHD